MSAFIDLTGRTYGRLTVIERAPSRRDRTYWKCRCICGAERITMGSNLKAGWTTSCGCSHRGDGNGWRKVQMARHGANWINPTNPWYKRSNVIWGRCKTEGYEFGFESVNACAAYLISIAPVRCPVFGFPLINARGAQRWDSPSVDRIEPSKGYVSGNLQIISIKANIMKQNATSEELRQFALWVLKKNGARKSKPAPPPLALFSSIKSH